MPELILTNIFFWNLTRIVKIMVSAGFDNFRIKCPRLSAQTLKAKPKLTSTLFASKLEAEYAIQDQGGGKPII